tara:strand:- start:34 stop:237 length:204 start_codon:yes stop_codon:yes gene_type:complete
MGHINIIPKTIYQGTWKSQLFKVPSMMSILQLHDAFANRLLEGSFAESCTFSCPGHGGNGAKTSTPQ